MNYLVHKSMLVYMKHILAGLCLLTRQEILRHFICMRQTKMEYLDKSECVFKTFYSKDIISRDSNNLKFDYGAILLSNSSII